MTVRLPQRKFVFKIGVIGLILVSPFAFYHLVIFIILEKENSRPNTSYRNYLLEEIPSPRIILESGSNTNFGIHAQTLEKTFNIPCINIADDVAIPLFMRIARLRQLSYSNDIIILPLEYIYYNRNKIPHQIFIRLHRDLNYFYEYLSLKEKVNLSFAIPPATLIDNIFQESHHVSNSTFSRSRWIGKYLVGSEWLSPFGDFENYSLPSKWKYSSDTNFTKYNYGEKILEEPTRAFLDLLSGLADLKANGRVIFFTWPVICGSPEELKVARGFSAFYQKIRQNVEDAGFVFLGEPEETMFDAKKFMYDTPAHLNEKGRQIRTKLLIDHLKPHLGSMNLKKHSNHTTIHHLQQKHKAYLEEELNEFSKFEPKSFNLQRSAPRKAKELCFLGKGWSSWEQDEVWSVGEKSIIYLKTPVKKRWDIAEINISGFYHNKLKSSKLFIAGHTFGDFDLRRDNTIKLTPSMVGRNGMVELAIKHISPESPNEISESTDRRQLAFRWENISLSFIENAHFADCYEEIKTWYGKYLNRLPDHKGHLFWTNALVAINTEDDRKKLEAYFELEARSE